ncbi:NmrA family transcriptional regulator [Streptomyces sp. Act143]|uniref:NmrA/HSCARG family protein n=1 Tax=Streptomyces sp. Act143 TaxID=2200760 RepID=UPI000D67C90F|nr:NmrA/HSCARG family protein [Streptomyces sp. Act143]PWI14480.1 NmrA family transcriptional regulator [Streptomyces sp. Act143]
MTDAPILVLAATGGQGRAVTGALLGRQAPVRVLVRAPHRWAARELAEQGVEVAAGSLSDVRSLSAAMHGVAGVFAYTTPFEAGPAAEVAQGRAIVSAAARQRVPHLVFSSVAGADRNSGVPHFESKARIEADLASGDVPYTILGPAYFFDNVLGGHERVLRGVLDLPLPADRPLQQLARADLGAFAAEVLLDPGPFLGQRIELAGDAPTPVEMAAALSKVLGRDVRHEQVPLGAIGDPDMHAMWAFLNGPGYRVDIRALHEAHPEVAWTRFGDWAGRAWAGVR